VKKFKLAIILLFILAAAVYSQDEMMQRGLIPEELLRPRREEAPRYPIDTVIGPLGQGRASPEAYRFARGVAEALLEGNATASSLSTANSALVENCLSALNAVNPRYFRIGNGRDEPDGSVSFLVRFAGREEGVIGELFIRFIERRTPTPPEAPPALLNIDTVKEAEANVDAPPPPPPPPPTPPPVQRVWVFEDLILEEPRSREEENRASRLRYDFTPYERLF